MAISGARCASPKAEPAPDTQSVGAGRPRPWEQRPIIGRPRGSPRSPPAGGNPLRRASPRKGPLSRVRGNAYGFGQVRWVAGPGGDSVQSMARACQGEGGGQRGGAAAAGGAGRAADRRRLPRRRAALHSVEQGLRRHLSPLGRPVPHRPAAVGDPARRCRARRLPRRRRPRGDLARRAHRPAPPPHRRAPRAADPRRAAG